VKATGEPGTARASQPSSPGIVSEMPTESVRSLMERGPFFSWFIPHPFFSGPLRAREGLVRRRRRRPRGSGRWTASPSCRPPSPPADRAGPSVRLPLAHQLGSAAAPLPGKSSRTPGWLLVDLALSSCSRPWLDHIGPGVLGRRGHQDYLSDMGVPICSPSCGWLASRSV